MNLKKIVASCFVAGIMLTTCHSDVSRKDKEEYLVQQLKPHLSEGLMYVTFVDDLPGDFCGAYFPPGIILIDRNSDEKYDEHIAKVLCHEVGHHEYFKLTPETKKVLDKVGVDGEIFAQMYEINWPSCYK